MWNWLGHFFGLDNASGPMYLFWSGIAGANLPMLGLAIVALRKHNCHVKGCPRLGRHPVEGTTWVVCRRHHPDDSPTAADVAGEAPCSTSTPTSPSATSDSSAAQKVVEY